ncbi:MAG: two-component sensor histidine kinase [Thiohalocapsa sp.]|nr:two-component sensor histidine kinase [Thiohalocapsa sp.]MCF7989509.1 two-component sensor histidine kinase [Thiohalocapsa sp.]
MQTSSPIAKDSREKAALSGRRALVWLFLYRLVLASIVAVIFYVPESASWLRDADDTRLVRLLLAAHATLILASGLFIWSPLPSREHQIEIAVLLDIGVYTLVMHLSGGVATGLGVLPAIAVVAGAILMEGRLSLLFASLATIAIMAQQFYANLQGHPGAGNFTQVGLLGLTYFAVALLAHVLTTRLRETERLAAKRKVDIADLSKLNDYVIQSMSTGVVVIDGERNMMLMNHAARALLGAPWAKAGDSLFELSREMRNWFRRELRGENPPDSAVALKNGEARLTLHLLGEGRDTGALIYLRDSQELLRQAQEMKLASLGRLTASIAHNIRNPLSSVNHAAQLLAESPTLDDDDKNLLGIIRRNAQRIDETVISVLDLSRRRQPDTQTVELDTWLREFCAEYRENHPETDEQLHFEPIGEKVFVQVDPRHLDQILGSLCENAFKHGMHDGRQPIVTIAAERDPYSGAIHITVTDDGPGISAKHVRNVFEPFFTTSSSGTGLGLYTAREFAEANGMRLEYIDQPNPGARFRLNFSK